MSCVCHDFASVHCCLVVNCWESADLLALVCDLVYKFKRIGGKTNIIVQFKKISKRYKKVRYNMDIMRQSACLVVNLFTVDSFGFLFNCTTVGQASDVIMALM